MKAAFTVWNDRIAPVFDVARRIHLVESVEGLLVASSDVALIDGEPALKARQLMLLGVGVLVCGAISMPAQRMVTAYGIDLMAFIHGNLQTVVDAWRSQQLLGDGFRMPGCKRGGDRPQPNQDGSAGSWETVSMSMSLEVQKGETWKCKRLKYTP